MFSAPYYPSSLPRLVAVRAHVPLTSMAAGRHIGCHVGTAHWPPRADTPFMPLLSPRMPVDQKALLTDCQKQLKLLEADLKAQATAIPALDASLRAEYAS